MQPLLTDYLGSSNPCLFIPTVEEYKTEKLIKKALIELDFIDRDFCIWKKTFGLVKFDRGSWKEPGATPTGRPINKLDEALRYVASTPKTIGVFFHPRFFINDEDGQLIQTIIDSAYTAKGNFSTIIFVGSFLDLPPELFNIVTLCDIPLPSKEELVTMITPMAKNIQKTLKNFYKNNRDLAMAINVAAEAAIGLDTFSAENAVALAITMTGRMDPKIIQAQKEQQIRKSDVLEYIITDESLDDVGGFDNLKEWLSKRKEGFTDKAKDYGLSWPKGILLVGSPGVGKSFCIKAIASYLGLPLLKMDMGSIFKQYVGSSEDTMRRALKVAEAVSPVVLALDEIDKAMSGLESSGQSDAGTTARVLATLLTWRQETKYPIFIVATANDPSAIPSMVYRKGRIDEIWGVDLPNLQERAAIFKIHLRRRNRSPGGFNIKELAKLSTGFTGAEIEACIEDAMFSAFSEGEEVSDDFLKEAIKHTKPQSSLNSEENKKIQDWIAYKARPVSRRD